MARPPRGKEVLLRAQQQLAKASDAQELRILQAVILSLVHAFSTQQTAAVVGRSPRWVTTARNDYIRRLEAGRKEQKKIEIMRTCPSDKRQNFSLLFLKKPAVAACARSCPPVHHASIALPPRESLSDEQWQAVGCAYLEGMGFTNNQYVVVRHTDTAHPHIHILVNALKSGKPSAKMVLQKMR